MPKPTPRPFANRAAARPPLGARRRMPEFARVALCAAVVVVALQPLVYASQAQTVARPEGTGTVKLPANVAETREQILAAVRAASLDDLIAVVDASHTKPDFGHTPHNDPLAALKSLSRDGRGLDVLAALADCLDVGPAALPLGRDLENNLIYVWPYLAERPLDQLSATEEIDLHRLVPPDKVAEMREKKRWLWWRLVLAADGSWMSFKIAE